MLKFFKQHKYVVHRALQFIWQYMDVIKKGVFFGPPGMLVKSRIRSKWTVYIFDACQKNLHSLFFKSSNHSAYSYNACVTLQLPLILHFTFYLFFWNN